MKKLAVGILLAWLASFGLAVAQTASVQHASSTGLVNNLLVETNPLHVLSGYGCIAITGGTAGFCIVVSAASVPGGGALTAGTVVDYCQITSSAGCAFSRYPYGVSYPLGMAVLLSSATDPFHYTTGTLTGALWADYN